MHPYDNDSPAVVPDGIEELFSTHDIARAFGKAHEKSRKEKAAVAYLRRSGQVPPPDFYHGSQPLWIPATVLNARNAQLRKTPAKPAPPPQPVEVRMAGRKRKQAEA